MGLEKQAFYSGSETNKRIETLTTEQIGPLIISYGLSETAINIYVLFTAYIPSDSSKGIISQ